MKNVEKVLDSKLAVLGLDLEEQEVVRYGILQFTKSAIGLTIALCLGAIMDVFAKAVVFLAGYFILRVYTGGYHAKTERGCAFSSFIILILTFVFFRVNWFSLYAYIILEIIGVIMIVVFSPVENANRQLSDLEKKVFRRKSIMISISIITLSLVLIGFGLSDFVKSTAAIIVDAVILMMAGKLGNKGCDGNGVAS